MARKVLVIGAGGSAGLRAAKAAHKLGAVVTAVESTSWASFCVERGCMPKIVRHESSAVLAGLKHASSSGFVRDLTVGAIDWPFLTKHEKALDKRYKRARLTHAADQPFKRIDGSVIFDADGTPIVNGCPFKTDAIIIATGSQVILPTDSQLPGITAVPYLTSDAFLRLEKMPERLAVIGGGVIGLELSQQAALKGARVKLFSRRPLLHRWDKQVGQVLFKALQRTAGLDINVGAELKSISFNGKITISTHTRERGKLTEKFDALLVALGRRARLPEGLKHTDIKINADGSLCHGDDMQTSLARVYCAGDVAGSPMLLHVANREGQVAGVNAARGTNRARVDYSRNLQAIYVEPAFAMTGLTEQRAQQERIKVWTHVLDLSTVGRYIAQGVKHGTWKIVADRTTGEILGSQIVAPGADSEIHLVHTMIMNHDCLDQIAEKYDFLHPTRTEALLNFVNAWKVYQTKK